MAIKKFSDLPSRKRPGAKQTALAKSLKLIPISPRRIKQTKRQRIDRIYKGEPSQIPNAIKSYRRLTKENFGVLFRNSDGEVIGRTHFASAKTIIPESLAIKFLSKYGLFGASQDDEIEAQAILAPKVKPSNAAKKTPAKKAAKKTPAKKAAKKTPAKKAAKKTPAKKAAKKTPAKKVAKKTPAKKAAIK